MKTIKIRYRLSFAVVRGGEVDHVSDTIWLSGVEKNIVKL